MCDPRENRPDRPGESEAVMGGGVSAGGAAVGIQALSGAYGGYQAKQQGDILGQNASIAEQNIPFIRSQAAEKARQLQVGKYLTIGKQRAGYGKAGLAQGGSIFDVMADTTANFNRDTSFTILEGELAARGQQRQADLSRFQAKTGMRDAVVGGVLNTGAMYAKTQMPAFAIGYGPVQ